MCVFTEKSRRKLEWPNSFGYLKSSSMWDFSLQFLFSETKWNRRKIKKKQLLEIVVASQEDKWFQFNPCLFEKYTFSFLGRKDNQLPYKILFSQEQATGQVLTVSILSWNNFIEKWFPFLLSSHLISIVFLKI